MKLSDNKICLRIFLGHILFLRQFPKAVLNYDTSYELSLRHPNRCLILNKLTIKYVGSEPPLFEIRGNWYLHHGI